MNLSDLAKETNNIVNRYYQERFDGITPAAGKSYASEMADLLSRWAKVYRNATTSEGEGKHIRTQAKHEAGNCHCGLTHTVAGADEANQAPQPNYTSIIGRSATGPDPLVQEP